MSIIINPFGIGYRAGGFVDHLLQLVAFAVFVAEAVAVCGLTALQVAASGPGSVEGDPRYRLGTGADQDHLAYLMRSS